MEQAQGQRRLVGPDAGRDDGVLHNFHPQAGGSMGVVPAQPGLLGGQFETPGYGASGGRGGAVEDTGYRRGQLGAGVRPAGGGLGAYGAYDDPAYPAFGGHARGSYTGGNGAGGDTEEGAPSRRRLPRNYCRDDACLRDDVVHRFVHRTGAELADVEVEVKEGVVTLAGRVPSGRDKRELERIAAEVRGVRSVEDRLAAEDEEAGDGGAASV